MPIFEYVCKGCGKKFEAIVSASKPAQCPACQGSELEQQLSTFAVRASSSHSGVPAMMPCGMPYGSCGGGSCGNH